LTRPSVRTHERNTRRQPPHRGQGGVRRWPGRIIASKEAPVGVEPNLDSATTADGDCGCANCPGCCAANALQGGRPDCPALASLDAELQRVVGAWDELPTHIRKTILALVGFADLPATGTAQG